MSVDHKHHTVYIIYAYIIHAYIIQAYIIHTDLHHTGIHHTGIHHTGLHHTGIHHTGIHHVFHYLNSGHVTGSVVGVGVGNIGQPYNSARMHALLCQAVGLIRI